MKILMTTDAVGGVWTYSIELSRELAHRGHEVLLACMGPAPEPAQRAEAAHAQLVEGPYRLEWMQEPWADVDRAGAWLVALEEEHRPDVIHLNGYSHAALAWRAPTLVVAHSDVFTWWKGVHGTLPPVEWDVYRERVARGLDAADLVVSPTRALLTEMRPVYRFTAPALVIPNGRTPPPPRKELKEPRVLAVGRAWDKAKDVRTLDEAARGIGWNIEVVGDAKSPDGGETAPLRHARALGRVAPAELVDAYARASIFVHPALYEPFGLAPLEAAHLGCALVLADIPTLREVWGDAALYAAPRDPTALQARLRTLIDDGALRAQLARKAQARASRYTASAMTERYLLAYERLLRAGDQEGNTSAS